MKKVVILILALSTAAIAIENKDQWKARMRQLGITLNVLMPSLVSESKFLDPKQAKTIDTQVNKLIALTHTMDPKNIQFDFDPTLQFLTEDLKSNLTQVKNALRKSDRSYAYTELRKITHTCISCHSRTESNSALNLKNLEPKGLSGFSRGEFLLIIRQFDSALAEFTKIALDPKVRASNHTIWQHSIRRAVSLLVKIKQSPEDTLQFVNQVRALPELPYYFEVDLDTWRDSLTEWKAESKPSFSSDKDYIKLAEKLFDHTGRSGDFSTETSKAIYYLRISTLMHDMLKKFPKSEYRGKALLLLGISYEAVADMDVIQLHDTFYTACIHEAPKSEVSKKCYYRIENSLLGPKNARMGVTPADLSERLGILRIKALAR